MSDDAFLGIPPATKIPCRDVVFALPMKRDRNDERSFHGMLDKIDILVVCFSGEGGTVFIHLIPVAKLRTSSRRLVNFCKLVDNNGKRKCTFSLSFMFLRAYLWIFSCCMDVLC